MSDKSNTNKKTKKEERREIRREKSLLRLNVAVILGVMTVATLFMTFGERPNDSLEENRDLAKCPEFSVESYLDGSFTRNFAKFYNDTVPMRSTFKLMISAFRANLGVDYDGGVHLEGGLPNIESRPPDESRPNSSSRKPPPAVVIPQTSSPMGSSSGSDSEPSESVSDDSSDGEPEESSGVSAE